MKIILLTIICAILFSGCEKNNDNRKVIVNKNENHEELKEFNDWLEKESKAKETLKNCKLNALNLPKTVSYYSFNNNIKAKIKIDSINYEFYEYDIYSISVKVSGEVLFGNNELIPVNYKLKDEEGNVIRTDHFTFIYELSKGDKFKDYEFIIYDIEPGKYTLEFYDCQL